MNVLVIDTLTKSGRNFQFEKINKKHTTHCNLPCWFEELQLTKQTCGFFPLLTEMYVWLDSATSSRDILGFQSKQSLLYTHSNFSSSLNLNALATSTYTNTSLWLEARWTVNEQRWPVWCGKWKPILGWRRGPGQCAALKKECVMVTVYKHGSRPQKCCDNKNTEVDLSWYIENQTWYWEAIKLFKVEGTTAYQTLGHKE